MYNFDRFCLWDGAMSVIVSTYFDDHTSRFPFTSVQPLGNFEVKMLVDRKDIIMVYRQLFAGRLSLFWRLTV